MAASAWAVSALPVVPDVRAIWEQMSPAGVAAAIATAIAIAAVALPLAAWRRYQLPPVPPDSPSTKLIDRYRRPTAQTTMISHRGFSNEAPENTLVAIRAAKAAGALGVEVDLRFTADGVGVLSHDADIERATGRPGLVRAMTLAQLREIDFSATHRNRDRFPNEKIPTLEEALMLCLELGLDLWIDVKVDPAAAADLIVPLVHQYRAHDRVVVCSFNPAVLWHVRKRDPRIVTAQTRKRYLLSYLNGERSPLYRMLGIPPTIYHAIAPPLDRFIDWCMHRWSWRLLSISFMLVHHTGVSEDYLDMWRRRGVGVVVWTVNRRAEKAYYLDYLRCPFMTDDPRVDVDAPDQVFKLPAAF